ncbi:MAG TPA: RAD55 family ATPase [Candidatus Dormibacteraeota bacterium]|nr:RAD55 family ATPase [Candidatus Dormibacteraeota bacterium]
MKLFERLLDTDTKADLLTLFHNNVTLSETPEQLAKRIGRTPTEVQRELDDLVDLGILRKVEVYSFGTNRDKEIQDAISKQLALGEVDLPAANGITHGTTSQTPKVRTGVNLLDNLLPDGLSTSCTIVFLSDPGAGEENLLAHLVGAQIESGKPVLYITPDNFPPNIRQSVSAHITKENVDWSTLLFVDCYSRTVGVESDEIYAVDPENLSAISIAMSEIMSKKPISMLVLDSFNTLIRKRGGHSAIEFLRVLVARTRQARCVSILTMNRKAFHPAVVASAQDVADGVIEFKVEEGENGIAYSLRILKMVGTRHSTAWARYVISDDGELVPYDESRL